MAESSPRPQDAGFVETAGKSPSLSNDEEGLRTRAGSPTGNHELFLLLLPVHTFILLSSEAMDI